MNFIIMYIIMLHNIDVVIQAFAHVIFSSAIYFRVLLLDYCSYDRYAHRFIEYKCEF